MIVKMEGEGKFCIIKTLYIPLHKNILMMKISQRLFRFWFSLLTIIAVVFSYFCSFSVCEKDFYRNIDRIFETEALLWGEHVLRAKGIPFKGKYDSQEYANKKRTTIVMDGDTLEISTSFHYPQSYNEYQRKNLDSYLLLCDDYDIMISDSLFKAIITRLNLTAESSVELKVRDLHQMFPTADSMYADAPFVKTFSSGSVEGYTTTPVGIGICNHALLYGHVKIPFSAVLSEMKWFGELQIAAISGLAVLFLLMYYAMQLFPLYRNYRKDVVFIGNTCIDLSHKELYLWSGECRHITDTRMSLLQMLVEAAPAYKLSKEEVCRNIWNLSPKDAQARYNVGMTDMRTLFIAEDPSLELKSLPREGMQLLVNESLVKKGRWHHFLRIYMKANSSK